MNNVPIEVCKKCGRVKRFGKWIQVNEPTMQRLRQYGVTKVNMCTICTHEGVEKIRQNIEAGKHHIVYEGS